MCGRASPRTASIDFELRGTAPQKFAEAGPAEDGVVPFLESGSRSTSHVERHVERRLDKSPTGLDRTEIKVQEVPTDASVPRVAVAEAMSPPEPSESHSPVPRKQRQVFLSYARGRESTLFARFLKQQLELAGWAVWMDEADIAPGVDWMQAIGSAIEQSEAMVCVLDPKYVPSGL